ncbi:MAG: hypothetical protein LJE70_09440 [Chromatiaceae bacterium]|nr:hypothetical protein [Chromatiaceae bacterium]
MNREYHRWYGRRPGRDMQLLSYGHSGAKLLSFPTRNGRFDEMDIVLVVGGEEPFLDSGPSQRDPLEHIGDGEQDISPKFVELGAVELPDDEPDPAALGDLVHGPFQQSPESACP